MRLIIDIPDEEYKRWRVVGKMDALIVRDSFVNGIPYETVTEFADRCRGCGREKVLDKIRTEIDSAKMPKNRMSFFRDGIDCALQIIDKYKAESEGKE